MCNPVIIFWAVAAVGAAMTAKGQYDQLTVEKGVAKNNAKVMDYQAADAVRRGEEEAMKVRRQAAALKAEQRAGFTFGHDMARTGIPCRGVADRIDRNLRVVLVQLDEMHIAQRLERELLRGPRRNHFARDGDFGGVRSVELGMGRERHPQKQKQDQRSHFNKVILRVITSEPLDNRYR